MDNPTPAIVQDGNSVAVYLGMQRGGGLVADFPLFNLTRGIGDWPAGATVGAATLAAMGYSLPKWPDLDGLIDRVANAIGTSQMRAPWTVADYPGAFFTRQMREAARAALHEVGMLEGTR